ncbi:UNVERIFIED_CONTAM: hypothetical protein NCL1_61501 [Trichonephila clavipes]
MVVVHFLLSAGKSSFVSNTTKTHLFIRRKKDLGFHYPHDSRVGRYFSHCSCKGKYLPCEVSSLFQYF